MSEQLQEIAKEIKFEVVQFYLKHYAWTEHASVYENLAIFKAMKDGEEWSIKLSKAKTNPALYTNGILDAIKILSEIEGSDPIAIATLLKQEQVDLHRLHLQPSPSSELTAPLFAIKQAINSFSSLLFDAMYEEAEEDPKGSATQFRGSCQFGHTFKGSFGLSIEAPTNMVALSLLPGETPATAERRASIRISSGLEVLSKAAADGSYRILEDAAESGLTIGMSKSLLEMAPTISAGNFAYEAYWSPFMPMSTPFTAVKIDKKCIPVLERFSASSSTANPELTIDFGGSVEKLQASRSDLLEADPDSKKFRFGIRGRSPQTGNCMLTFAVDLRSYLEALSAHDQKREVTARCTVRKRTRGWDVVHFESLRKV